MADIITTLHPENTPNDNLYPNIKWENIPWDIIKNNSTNYTDSNVVAPYNNLNTLPINEIVNYSGVSDAMVTNLPLGGFQGNVITYGNNATKTQIAFTRLNRMFIRTAYGYPTATYSNWVEINDTSKMITINSTNYTDSNVVAPYNNLNTLPINSVINYLVVENNVLNLPIKPFYGNVITYGNNTITTQIARSRKRVFIRYKYSNWREWEELTNTQLNETPYTLSLFETVGVIGDSFASGVIYAPEQGIHGHYYNLSWLQQLARMYGFVGVNYSFGGANTHKWLYGDNPRGISLFNSDTPKDLYIIALGINPDDVVGTINDCHLEDYNLNADTFYGNLGKIVALCQQKSPNGRIIISTTPSIWPTPYNTAIQEVANLYQVGYMDINQDDYLTSNYYKDFYTNHPTAVGYSGYAMMYARMIDKCIVNNVDYFKYYIGN